MEAKTECTALIVLGMHRSGTSAMAGLLGEMGCDLPNDLMAPDDMNAKGFFESNRITSLNEDLLASAGMTWFDLHRFPDAWYASSKALKFRQNAREAVREEFDGSGLFVMKDPRSCRLVPFWEEVLAEEGVQPVYVCIHRDPVEVSASLMRWANYEPLYGQALWLRHVLDAEIATRGKRRIFVSYDQLLSDWREVVGRIARSLDLVFPRSVQTATRGVQQFLSKDLKHVSLQELSVPRLDETSEWSVATMNVLNRWSQAGEDAADHATLDRVRHAFDTVSDTLVPVFDTLLAHYRDARQAREQTKTHGDAAARIQQLEEQLGEMEANLRNSQTNLHAIQEAFDEKSHRVQELEEQLDEMEANLRNSEANLHAIQEAFDEKSHGAQEQLGEMEANLRNSQTNLHAMQQAFHEKSHRVQELAGELERRTVELVKARQRPLRNLAKYLEFWALRRLSAKSSPLSLKVKSRFLRSANKRDPERYLPRGDDGPETVTKVPQTTLFERGQASFRSDLPIVIVASHDASRTGAPILALNMAQTLSERYNIATVCLRGGELLADFRQISTAIHVAEQTDGGGAQFAQILDAIAAKKIPVFAVVNSIESRHVLGALRRRRIPIVALFHEFASYTLPKTAFADAFHLTDEIVFSTELTLQNAVEQTCFVRTPRFHVLAQGRCEVPRRDREDSLRQIERDRLTGLLRPGGAEAGEFLVVGAGYVQIRKGVDLFIDVARRVLATEDGRNARFAWIGAGYDPERDAAYSVYIRDQIERADLADRMMMLDETSEIEHVYALSNLLLLSSRLDPLPNVAIDALSEGVPVICFDKTTGIADLLCGTGLRDACVADYLDTAQAADKVLRLIRSPETYRDVCDRSKTFAASAFDFGAYATRIEALGLGIAESSKTCAEDIATIAGAEDFDPAFMMSRRHSASGKVKAAEYYLTDNRREAVPRRPEPGFNSLVYARRLEAEGVHADAYAEFLRRSRPAGPWLRSVIRETASAVQPEGQVQTAALHIHAYYPEVVVTIAERLALNETCPDLFVSAGNRNSLNAALNALKDYKGHVAEARVVVNRGRDIGPLLTEFGSALVRDYDLIGHVHTKKSTLLSDRDLVDRWVRFVYENMLGGRHGGAMMDRVMAAFAGNQNLGLVFPADPNILAWSGNEIIARKLAPRLGLEQLPEFFDFPMGSMFWCRASALEPFVALDLGWNDYPAEPVRYDGTILHALERLFGLVAENQGMEIAVTNVKGVTR